MSASAIIYQKLEAFIKKFYVNELIRGIIFFLGLGLLYFLFTLFIEYFLWLKPIGRTVLFSVFIGVELFLLFRFILFPLFKLFHLQKGIEYKEASTIIGNHFSEVSDKLLNFLQLAEDKNQSELLVASIEQKANSLQPIPFGNAINFNKNKKYLPLAVLPLLFFAFFYLTGNSKIISQSFDRVVHFKKQFTPPAPFKFILVNDNLQTKQNQDFILKVKTEGKIAPENAMIYIGNESYFMESLNPGEFQFKISKPSENISFYIEANTVSSPEYELKVIVVPEIANFIMQLNFPKYLNKKPEIIKGSGNAIIPEGTNVTWKLYTKATDKVDWKDLNKTIPFVKIENAFQLTKNISQNTEYQIFTSNDKIQNYEKLNYEISVIKDQYPAITVNNVPDSLKVDMSYVFGQISDDYGLSKLQIVYHEKNRPETSKKALINIKSGTFDQFVFSFPSNLPVIEGVTYEYYFEVFDNDNIHNYKSTKSSVFSNRIVTESEKEDQVLQEQNDNIKSLEKSIKNQDKHLSEIDKLQKIGKEKDDLDYKDQQKLNEFINRQKKQDEMMKSFSEKMKENLEKFQPERKDLDKEELQKRLEKTEKEIEKNQKLLDELKKLNDKINNEELFEKLDQYKQNSKNQTKNLEQLVELTKRYYVEKKAEQIKDNLNKLAEKQEQLSDNDKENNAQKQEEINKEFDKIQEDIKDLQKENKELKSPLDIPKEEDKQESIDEDLKQAKDELQKDNKSKAKPKQKSASKKMKEMSNSMKQSMEGAEMEQLEEDVEMMRQILDNLLAFSFSQEKLMDDFKELKRNSPSFNKNLKKQQDLKLQFKHVDDSLFAMSLRNPKIGENINKEIGNVYYNVDKSIENLVEAQTNKALSHQQYTITSANKLADFLSDILTSMQMSLSAQGSGKPKPGKGKGDGMQLPDIIKKQAGLSDKMKKEGQKKPGEGQKPGEGKAGKEGKDGKSGKGNSQNGENGADGEGNAKAIMEIYQEQKQLREALENELNKNGLGGNGQNALDQMKQIEKQLLNKGFNNETLQRSLNLKYELLKLQQAIQQQGEEQKRQAETNKKEYTNNSKPLPSNLQDYLNSIEILNRQSLPLRSNFNQKVQEYFKTND